MKIAIVKTCDGDAYFATDRDLARVAAVEMVIDQLKYHAISVFNYEHQDKADEKIRTIESCSWGSRSKMTPYQFCMLEGLIREESLIERPMSRC